MIGEITAIMNVLKDTIAVSGELALYGLAGYAVFKLVTLASYLMLARYTIKRFWDYFMSVKERPKVYQVSIGTQKFMDTSEEELAIAIRKFQARCSRGMISKNDVEILSNAIDKLEL